MTHLLALLATLVPHLDQHGDPLPPGAVARFGTVRFRVGSDQIRHAYALSPDGNYLAVEDRDGICLWDTETGRVARRLPRPGGSDTPFGLAFSLDGKYLARLTGRVATVWDPATGRKVFGVELKDPAQAIGWGPAADQVTVTSAAGSRAWTFAVPGGKPVRVTMFQAEVGRLVPAGRLAVGRDRTQWFLFDLATGAERARFAAGARDDVVELSPDGRRAYHLTEAGRLRTVGVESGKVLEELDPPAGWPGSGRPRLAVAPDGSVAYLAQGDDVVRRRDLTAGTWLAPVREVPTDVLLPHPDGRRLLVVGPDGVLRRYDLATRAEVPGPAGFADPVFATPSPDGRRVLVEFGRVGRSNRLHLFDPAGRPVWTADPGLAEWGLPHWSPDGRWLACVRRDGLIVRDAATGKAVRTIRPVANADFDGPAFFPPETDRVVTPFDSGRVVAAFDLATGDRVRMWHPAARVVDLSPDGLLLLCFDSFQGRQVFDLAADRFRRDPERSADGPAAVGEPRFSPDGSYVFAWERERPREPGRPTPIHGVCRDPWTGAVWRSLAAGPDDPFEWAFAPDGLTLAVGTGRGDLRLFDVPTGRPLGGWTGHRDRISSVRFVGPGRVLTGSADTTALLWDVRPRRPPARPAWGALTGADPIDAWRAIWSLAADPRAPEHLRAKVAEFGRPPADAVRRWLADLGADRYAVREAATNGLRDLGRAVEPDLKAAREKVMSEEVRVRLDGLLARLTADRSPAEWVRLRAVAAMEAAGTAEARKLLTEWAAGPAGARLTADAKAALARLALR